MREASLPASEPTISGPAKVGITLRSARGPLARSRALQLPAKQLTFVNTGSAPVTLTRVSVDPLQEEQQGIAPAGAALRVDVAGPAVIEIGTPLIVSIAGSLPARPGSYVSVVRLQPETGSPLAVPVRITVAASSAWGVGLTLLGLSVVNLMTGLDSQGSVATKLREALHKRGEAQVFVEQHPLPDGKGAQILAMDRGYEAAITALSRPRSAGLLDHRLEDAAPLLADADGLAAALQKAADGQSPAEAVVAMAAAPWGVLRPQLLALSVPAAGPGHGENAGFAARLEGVRARLQDRLVGAPALFLKDELVAQVARLELLAASGELGAARTQALGVQTAMRRAAHSLANAQRIVMRQGAQNAFLLGTVAETERGLADPDIPAASHADLAARLDAAQAMLTDGAELPRLLDISRAVNAVATALAREAAGAVQARVAAGATGASAETDTPEVDQALAAAQADPDRSPANKKIRLHALLDAWRSTIGQARDPASRPALLASVGAVAAALDAGDMAGVSTSYRALALAWADYAGRRIAVAAGVALKPHCDAYAAHLQRRLGFIEQDLRWEEPDARSTEWDRRRDRIRLALERVAPGSGCLGALLALDEDSGGLTSEIQAAAADTAGIDAAVRAEALAIYGVAASSGPRALLPRTETPPSELLVDRRLRISVGNLDPAWGVGTMVRIDFGDNSPPVTLDAEALRQNPPDHAYARPLAAHVTAIATDGRVGGDRLGEGETTLLIAPAPESQARLLADRFTSARFGLALIVALAIYSWRFQSRDRVFGAKGFDYAEAFVLGFTVNAAIAGLPSELLSKLPIG